MLQQVSDDNFPLKRVRIRYNDEIKKGVLTVSMFFYRSMSQPSGNSLDCAQKKDRVEAPGPRFLEDAPYE